MAKKPLFSSFDAPGRQDWTDKATRDLKGKPLDKLNWKSPEGFVVDPYPFETQEPNSWTRGNAFNAMDSLWQTVQPVDVKNPASELIVREALEHGVPAFLFHSRSEKATVADFQNLWDLLDLSQHAIHLVSPARISSSALSEALIQKSLDAEQGQSLTGNIFTKPGNALPSISSETPWFRTAGVDLAWLEARGATASTQVAVALSHTVDLMDGQRDPEMFAKRLAYRFGIGGSFWVEVAKFRAFRMLVARVLEVMGIKQDQALSPFVMAETGLFNKARYDARTNMLRATSEAISAAVGGVHAIAVWPHNRLTKEASVADARMGRNILQLMRHESYLGRVGDPAGGSRYAENLSTKLAEEAWKQFQEIEALGGYGKASNWLDKKLGEAMASQHHVAATRKRSYVGVNNYTNPDEQIQPEIPETDLRPIAAYERLRAEVEKLPQRPRAFILMYSDRAMRNARNTFARNVLGILGLEIIENKQADDWEKSLKELAEQQPAVVCLCAADDDYSVGRVQVLRALLPKAAIVIAGKNQTGLQADYHIHIGADILGVLTSLVAGL